MNRVNSGSREAGGDDFVGYEVLIDFIKERSLHKLEGDIVEIGVFMGGGTAKLARFAQEYGKIVIAVDIFDPGCDKTADRSGVKMCDVYQAYLQGRSQLQVYQQATRGFDNILTVSMDSGKVGFPKRQKFIFGFIDGNHHPDHVKSDFNLVWSHLVPGGSVALHDYNFDLPLVTRTIDDLIEKHQAEISDTYEIPEKHIIILNRKKDASAK